jgi:hypothetical protein
LAEIHLPNLCNATVVFSDCLFMSKRRVTPLQCHLNMRLNLRPSESVKMPATVLANFCKTGLDQQAHVLGHSRWGEAQQLDQLRQAQLAVAHRHQGPNAAVVGQGPGHYRE